MTRKNTLPPEEPSDNAQHDGGDAREPEPAADTSFDPAALEGPSASPPTLQTGAAPDPFDPASFRLASDFGAGLGVKKALLSLPVRKPDKAWWVRVHPAEGYRLPTAVIELKGDRGSETYLVASALWPELAAEATFKPKLLATAMNRQGTLFIWEVNLPRPDGRADEWSRTALEAVNLATSGWVRVIANMDAGAYDVFQASGSLPDPEWPGVPFRDLLRVAFKERFIDSLDHPVLRRLRGEV